MFSSVGPAAPHVSAGKIRALAVTGDARLSVLPNVPTLAETGYPAATVLGYWGVLAPAGTPPQIVEKLTATIAAIVKRPDVRQRLIEQGVEPTGAGPAEYDRIIRAEIAKWAKVIKQAGIKVE
jgi:tripartite-type tricarboxylate transporter receptor subunit TctC